MIRLFLCEKFLKYLQTGSLLIHDRSENREQLNETEQQKTEEHSEETEQPETEEQSEETEQTDTEEQPDTETEQSEETGIST